MRIAVTGATGFLGHYIVCHLLSLGHRVRCWHRRGSDTSGFVAAHDHVQWIAGELNDNNTEDELLADCDAVVHSALFHPSGGFHGGEGELIPFVEKNVLGTLRLIEMARERGVGRFVFISSCAVHDEILPGRPLDETHPPTPLSHYGAHKAAIEQFVQSFGLGQKYPICALRPCGIYGLARPVSESKWYRLVEAIVADDAVDCYRGGKEVHAADVAQAVGILLNAPAKQIAGQLFNCCDRYISEFEVATLAKNIAASSSEVRGEIPKPKNQIITTKLQNLGMAFGGTHLLEKTVAGMVVAARAEGVHR